MDSPLVGLRSGKSYGCLVGTTIPSSSGSVFRTSSVELVRKTPEAEEPSLHTLELTANLRQSKWVGKLRHLEQMQRAELRQDRTLSVRKPRPIRSLLAAEDAPGARRLQG